MVGGAAAFLGGSSSSEELSESELLSAGLDGVLGVTAVLGLSTGLGVVFGVAVWAAGLAGASSSELSESGSEREREKNRTMVDCFLY